MNKGIRIATGDWINFMNSGDRFAQTEVLTLLFDHNFCLSSYGGIYGDAMFTQSGEPVGYFQNKPFWNLKYKFVGMGICHQSLFVRMDLAKSFLFNIKYKICADYDMCYKLYNSGYQFKYFPILISYFDRSGISSTDLIRD